MITVRLDPKLENNIQNTATLMGITKSELIRKSIAQYLNKLEKTNAWELGCNMFGRYSSGKGNLSKDRKALLKEKIKAKRR